MARKSKKEKAIEAEAQTQTVQQEETKVVLQETVTPVVEETPKSQWDLAVERFNNWKTKK